MSRPARRWSAVGAPWYPACMLRRLVAAGFLVGMCLAAPGLAARPSPVEVKTARDVLRIRNRTPFMLTVYFGGVRAGWIKPFRTELFKGLKAGYQKIYVHSHYGSASWGPKRVWVPGTWNLTPPPDAKTTEDMTEAMASRIYRRNRNSLVACDRLAERRGEEIAGQRADFEIKVDAEGKATVSVTGSGGKRLRTCYAAVAKTWEYPSVGSDYTVTFQHIP
jgi:hypothetical protein